MLIPYPVEIEYMLKTIESCINVRFFYIEIFYYFSQNKRQISEISTYLSIVLKTKSVFYYLDFFVKFNPDCSTLTSLVSFPLKHNSFDLSLYRPDTTSVSSQSYFSIIGWNIDNL